MDPCVFCRIVTGEIPASKVLETNRSLAFRDLVPQAPTHVLVVPKVHVAHAGELGPDHGELLADLFGLAQQVAVAEGLDERGHRLVLNVGRDSGNTVPHLHLHVLGGQAMGWPPFPRT